MAVTNKRKESICIDYSTYLKIIYHFGNKVILMKQLFEYAKAFGLAKHYPEFHGHITDLVENDILRQEPFGAFDKKTQLHMLTMRKYGIRFVEGKTSSQDVGAVPKANSNERILVSIFKNHNILFKQIPRLQKNNAEISFESIINLLKMDKSTLLFNKNKGLDYLSTWKDTFIDLYCDVNTVNYDIKSLETLRDIKKVGLRRGSELSEGKGTGKALSGTENVLENAKKLNEKTAPTNGVEFGYARKQHKLSNFNIESMLNGYSYIAQIKESNNVLVITVLLIDLNNKQDFYKMTTQIATIFHMFDRYLKVDFKLKFGIIAFDAEGQKNMEFESRRVVKHAITKEVKGIMLQNTLENWGMDYIAQKKVEVQFTNYDITNTYLDGIKHANLLRK